jgi:nucleotide-binding universal stress UspA family protein
LHLVSVHEPMPPLGLPPDFPVEMADLEQEWRLKLEEHLETAVRSVEPSLPTPVVTAVLAGEAASSLCAYVQSHSMNLVVMTTHGRGGLSRMWLGSVADRMVRRLQIPLLLLHPRELPQPTAFHRILLALDGEIEEPVLEAAMALGRMVPDARCVLTRVVEPLIPILSGLAARPGHLPSNWNELRQIEARNYLARLTDRLGARGVQATSQVLVGRGVAEQVLRLADAVGADCIVTGTHGARGMERLLLGSVADKIVRGARVPVLVVPAGRGGASLALHQR